MQAVGGSISSTGHGLMLLLHREVFHPHAHPVSVSVIYTYCQLGFYEAVELSPCLSKVHYLYTAKFPEILISNK